MWVLSTDRAELHFFASPEDIPGGHGALSHVWDKEEQSFQDVRRIQGRCANDGTNPRDFVCEKIRRCCELAERHGHKWVWIDTCCIDKTSSAELSEAINSMFRYYALANVCYGYLRDVPALDRSLEDVTITQDHCRLEYNSWCDSFERSIWFNRGWTLQELIAPRFFLFLSQSWEVLGTKAGMAELLERRTNIPPDVLRLRVSHTKFSIAQRMSWFGRRETTRLEDEAYCLLGLFDIHMPPLYGEGRHAFRRLQEELLNQSADTTLFAWEDFSLDHQTQSWLFAPAPSAFRLIIDVVYAPPRQHQDHPMYRAPALRGLHGGDVTFRVTPYGILAYIPVYHYRDLIAGDLYWSRFSPDLSRQDEPDSGLLCLEEDQADGPTEPFQTVRPSYRVYCGISRIQWITRYDGHLNRVTGTLVFHGETMQATWQEVLIRHRPPPHWLPGQVGDRRTSFIPTLPIQLTLNAPFRFDEAHIRKLMDQSKARHVEIRNAGLQSSLGPGAESAKGLPTAYIFAPTALIDDRGFDPYTNVRFIMIKVGRCRLEGLRRNQPGPPVWATVYSGYISDSRRLSYAQHEMVKLSDDPGHDCLEDHVWEWPSLQKMFHVDVEGWLPDAGVSLTFAPCPINEGETLVLDARINSVNDSGDCSDALLGKKASPLNFPHPVGRPSTFQTRLLLLLLLKPIIFPSTQGFPDDTRGADACRNLGSVTATDSSASADLRTVTTFQLTSNSRNIQFFPHFEEEWPVKSALNRQLLRMETQYATKEETEKKCRFNLADSLKRAEENGRELFSGIMFYVTPKVPVDIKLLMDVVAANGGQLSTQTPTVRKLVGRGDRFVISCLEDVAIWRPLSPHYKIYTHEFILESALSQAVSWDDEAFLVPGS